MTLGGSCWQRELNELWAPPELKFSTLYASTVKLVWLCLLYAPLYPPLYLLTAVGAATFEPATFEL